MRRALSIFLCVSMLLISLTACNASNGGVTADPQGGSSPPTGGEEVGDGGSTEEKPLVKDDAYYAALNLRDQVLKPLENDFRSRTSVTYSNVNGKNVTAYTLYREPNDGMNNPNFAQAVMLWQCTKYKIAHPDERVVATLATFHLSVHAAACLDPNSQEYGRMENLYDRDYDEQIGYYRLSWLMVDAARHGVEMLVIGDLDASPTTMSNGISVADGDFFQYFEAFLSQPSLIEGRTIGDYLTVRRVDWTSYGDKSATDMMHLKLCTVSHRLANDGTEKGPAIWVGSINLDGVNDLGINSHNSIQSAVVITEHEELRRIMNNYMYLLKDYCGQEDVTVFRDIVNTRTSEQIDQILSGQETEIPTDKQIVYMGSETDSIFELYFTPFGGSPNQWNENYNPFCRYFGKLLSVADGENAIQVIWNNVKYKQSFGLADTIVSVMANIFRTNQHEEDMLLLQLPMIQKSDFGDLPENENIRINERSLNFHIKDLQLSYVENGKRQWVVLYNTLNMHEGSMSYQSNLLLMVKETEETGNHFYTDYAIMTTPGTNFEQYRIDPK